METICKKRKKRRDNKKRLIREKSLTSKIQPCFISKTKTSLISNINQDDVVQTVPPDTNVSSDITTEKFIQNEPPGLPVWEPLEPDEDNESDHRWDHFIEEEKTMRDNKAARDKHLQDLYGEYTDTQPCFPMYNNNEDFTLPKHLEPLDRIAIKANISGLKSKEEQAKEIARHYRDSNARLKSEILKLKADKLQIKAESHEEKEKVRHFWRNKDNHAVGKWYIWHLI